MNILDLPPEVLSSIVSYACYAPTRRRRRQALLSLSRVCSAFSAQCLRQIYQKLAYEISPKGAKLLELLQHPTRGIRYTSFVRAIAIREREGAPQRKLINSRDVIKGESTANGHSNLATRQRKSVLEAVLEEERRIGNLLSLVKTNLAELKYETNLLPAAVDETAPSPLSQMLSLQSLILVPDPPYPDNPDYESRLRAATFTLSLPPESFRPAFLAYKNLNHLDLWKCSFKEFASGSSITDEALKPSFRLTSLSLGECILSGEVLNWLLSSTLDASSLRTLKLSFVQDAFIHVDPSPIDVTLRTATIATFHEVGPSLEYFSFEADEAALDDALSINIDSVPSPHLPPSAVKSCFAHLGRDGMLKTLRLGGRAVTAQHIKGISQTAFSSLRNLEMLFCPNLPPSEVIDILKIMPSSYADPATHIKLQGSEDFRRRNLREILRTAPSRTVDATGGEDWTWSRQDWAAAYEIIATKEFSHSCDRVILLGIGAEDPSSDEGDFDMGDFDEAADFEVTAEQLEQERMIEAEELNRTWESGSEY